MTAKAPSSTMMVMRASHIWMPLPASICAGTRDRVIKVKARTNVFDLFT